MTTTMQNIAADFTSLLKKYKANDAPLDVFVLVNSERLLFRKFNFEFKLLLQEIFPLQILNKIALNKT